MLKMLACTDIKKRLMKLCSAGNREILRTGLSEVILKYLEI